MAIFCFPHTEFLTRTSCIFYDYLNMFQNKFFVKIKAKLVQ